MKNLWLIVKEDFKNLILNPMWVFFATGYPVALIVIMGYITKDGYGSGMSSFDYYGITLMIYAILNSGCLSANAFLEERIKKPNMRIIFAPGSAKNIYLSKIIASTAFGFIFHLIDMVFVCVLFQIKINHIAELIVLFGLLELLSNTLGVMLCCILKKESTTNQILSIVINIIGIFGGLLFSLDGFGKTVRMISLASPVKWVVNASFQMIYDNQSRLFLPCAVIMIVSTLVMVFVCSKTFRKEDCVC